MSLDALADHEYTVAFPDGRTVGLKRERDILGTYLVEVEYRDGEFNKQHIYYNMDVDLKLDELKIKHSNDYDVMVYGRIQGNIN